MSQPLSAKSKMLFTYLAIVLFITYNMNPLMQISVMLIFIFIVTEVTIIPSSSFVLFDMSVKISNIFEASFTVLFHAL